MRCALSVLTLLAILAFNSGCGPAEPTMAKVHGKVTLDGVPVDRGMITFILSADASVLSRSEINNGSYEGKAVIGSSRIQIWGDKKVGEKARYEGDPNSPMVPIYEEMIPQQFNAMSGIQKDVKAGENEFDFLLSTK